jgi:hypothetical protein
MDNEFERIWKEKSAVITGSIRVLRNTEENYKKKLADYGVMADSEAGTSRKQALQPEPICHHNK